MFASLPLLISSQTNILVFPPATLNLSCPHSSITCRSLCVAWRFRAPVTLSFKANLIEPGWPISKQWRFFELECVLVMFARACPFLFFLKMHTCYPEQEELFKLIAFSWGWVQKVKVCKRPLGITLRPATCFNSKTRSKVPRNCLKLMQ